MKIGGRITMLASITLGMAYSYFGIDNLIIVVGIFGVFFLGLIDWFE